MSTVGLLLAAGGGSRMGMPKALVHDERGGWLTRAVDSLAGCDRVVAVLGARAEEARPLLDTRDVTIVVAADWAEGMGASLATGIGQVLHGGEDRCLVTLVDLPDVGADVVLRMLAQPDTPSVLARATYGGRPGHPVLLGRDHWAGVLEVAEGDRGARDYLRGHAHVDVDCSDLATGRDVDEPPR